MPYMSILLVSIIIYRVWVSWGSLLLTSCKTKREFLLIAGRNWKLTSIRVKGIQIHYSPKIDGGPFMCREMEQGASLL